MYQHVKFYSEDGKKKSVECVFRSQKALDSFILLADNFAGCNIFAWDIINENKKNFFSLAVIPANMKGLKRICNLLYPNLVL